MFRNEHERTHSPPSRAAPHSLRPLKRSWRFLPLADPHVERFVARDIDSRLTERDQAAVFAWVNSGKKFHVVRDHPSHSNFPMSGGMWGAVRGALPNVAALIKGGGAADAYLADMNFLTRSVWPIAKQSLLQHDAFSCQPGGRYGKGEPIPHFRDGGEHLGAVYLDGKMRRGDVNILVNAKRPKECTPPEEFAAWSVSPEGGMRDHTKRACTCADIENGRVGAATVDGKFKFYCDLNNGQSPVSKCQANCVHIPNVGHANAGICVSK